MPNFVFKLNGNDLCYDLIVNGEVIINGIRDRCSFIGLAKPSDQIYVAAKIIAEKYKLNFKKVLKELHYQAFIQLPNRIYKKRFDVKPYFCFECKHFKTNECAFSSANIDIKPFDFACSFFKPKWRR